MTPTTDGATRAAVAVAARFGINCAEPEVLADGANVIVHLRPVPVVAKVAASTPVVRADVAEWLQHELDVTSFLANAGVPVATPSTKVPATVQHGNGHVMSFWEYQATPPVLAPLGDIPAFLARPQTLLSPAEVSALSEAFEELTTELTAEEPHPGRLLRR